MARPSESRRLRIAYLLTLATSISLVITSTMIIVNVGPLLPQPQRDANIRLGVILALACSATLSSALLVTTEVMNYRYHGEHFLCVPNSGMYFLLFHFSAVKSTEVRRRSSSDPPRARLDGCHERQKRLAGAAATREYGCAFERAVSLV